MAISKVILNGDTLMDVTSDTVEAEKLLSGETATKNDGTKVTGNITNRSSTDIIVDGPTVTTVAGYYPLAVSTSIEEGSAFTPAVTITSTPWIGFEPATGVISASFTAWSSVTPTINPGYVSTGTAGRISASGRASLSLPILSYQTFYPSTARQTISSGVWLTGEQTIASITTSNLTAKNIAEGVVVKVGDSVNASRITQITGTHKSSTGPKYTATIVSSGKQDTMGQLYNYVKYDNTFYLTEGQTFEFSAGDSLHCVLNAWDNTYTTSIYIDGELVKQATRGTSYDYILPASDIEIKLNTACTLMYIDRVSLSITENGKYDVNGYGYANVSVNPTLMSKTVNPMESIQTVTPDTGYDGLSQVTVNAISSNYVGTAVPLASAQTITPTESIQTAVPSGYYTTGPINVNAIPSSYVIPSGTYSISSNGTYDVGSYKSVSVNATGEYYGIYKALANRVTIRASGHNGTWAGVRYNYTSEEVSNWCDSLTSIYSNQFAGQFFSGSFYFNNVTSIGQYGFGWPYVGAMTTQAYGFFYFPSLSYLGYEAFVYNTTIRGIECLNCKTIQVSTFRSCAGLQSVNFPSCTSIGNVAFYNCSSLSITSFPMVESIGNSVFYNCSSLSVINFPNCTSIGDYAFQSCRRLSQVILPKCKFMGSRAFSGCYNLISLDLQGVTSVPTLSGANWFYSTPIGGYSASAGQYGSIYVPASLYNDYITATNWSLYSARIVSV